MHPRFTFSTGPAPPAQRKSRVDGKLSFIPKPKLRGSSERLSEAGWRPGRPRSLEPPRAGVPTGRPSRERSATKLPPNQRSRSAQQSEGLSLMTPLSKPRSTMIHNSRSTTTPMRTPSNDRSGRSWQNSLERALAFVTTKDKRQISNIKWQKATGARVNEELERRGAGGGSGGAVLMKPLTINRFVDITAGLLACLQEKARLDSANYVTKLPHITKRLLYPGVVSKSWLKTVNTLHTYPSALALIAYLLDLVLRVESPVDEVAVYAEKDELSCLKRQFLAECWQCFNQDSNDFSAAEDDYLMGLRRLLGNDDEKVALLKENIEAARLALEDPSEQAARADEQRRQELLAQLLEALREHKSRRIQDNGRMDAACNEQTSLIEATHQLQADNERFQQELQQVKREVASQPLSTAERAQLLDKVDYSNRVIDSKNELVQQVSKMLHKTESDLALSQKHCLAACVEYNQRIISLTSDHADCAGLAVEERDLMKSCTVEAVEGSVEALRAKHARLTDAVKEAERSKLAATRRLSEQNYQLDQINTKLSEAMELIEQEKVEIRLDREGSAAEREAAARDLRELHARADQLTKKAAQLAAREDELAAWDEEERLWKKNLQDLSDFVAEQQQRAANQLAECKYRALNMLLDNVKQWTNVLREINAQNTQK